MHSDTNPIIDKIQIDLIRRASVGKRLALMNSISITTRQLARRAISRAHPECNAREIDILFVRYHYGDKLAEQLNRYLAQR